jgi:transcriptional regulator with XRE-family HTH domain
MRRRPLESLGGLVRAKRGKATLRKAAAEIGIGPATLLRVESGRVPDVSTFGKLCSWLGRDPREFLGVPPPPNSEAHEAPDVGRVQVSAYFRMDQAPQPETMGALAQMLILARQLQPRLSNEPDADA